MIYIDIYKMYIYIRIYSRRKRKENKTDYHNASRDELEDASGTYCHGVCSNLSFNYREMRFKLSIYGCKVCLESVCLSVCLCVSFCCWVRDAATALNLNHSQYSLGAGCVEPDASLLCVFTFMLKNFFLTSSMLKSSSIAG